MEMKQKMQYLAIVIVLMFGVCLQNSQAQNAQQTKEIAITFDDLPLNGPHIELKRLQTMTDKLLAGFKAHHVPVVGFVNESLLYAPGEVEQRIALLRAWADGGAELGNHTFSHLGFKDAPLAAYEDDFIRGDAITRMIMKQKGGQSRFFRHPFLQMGPTRETELSFESFIKERGYQIAPVTIDTMDWMILSAYLQGRAQGDAAMEKRVSDEYLKFAEAKFEFCEKETADLFGHQIKHILLLHANELNADNIDALLSMIEKRGYRFISVEEALKDPVYQYPADKYLPVSDWLGQWAFSQGKHFNSPVPPAFLQKAYDDAQKSHAAH